MGSAHHAHLGRPTRCRSLCACGSSSHSGSPADCCASVRCRSSPRRRCLGCRTRTATSSPSATSCPAVVVNRSRVTLRRSSHRHHVTSDPSAVGRCWRPDPGARCASDSASPSKVFAEKEEDHKSLKQNKTLLERITSFCCELHAIHPFTKGSLQFGRTKLTSEQFNFSKRYITNTSDQHKQNKM